MYVKKGQYHERACVECGKTMRMYSSRKRCPECARKRYLEYQREYSRLLWADMKRIRSEGETGK